MISSCSQWAIPHIPKARLHPTWQRDLHQSGCTSVLLDSQDGSRDFFWFQDCGVCKACLLRPCQGFCSLLVDAHLIVIQNLLEPHRPRKSHGVQTLKVHEQSTYICCVVCVSCVLMLWLVVPCVLMLWLVVSSTHSPFHCM